MLSQRLRARFAVPIGMFLALAGFAPAALAQSTFNANDDALKAAPTGVRDVLANDSGSGAALRIVSNTQPANGTASCSELGACLYSANAGFTGTDTFTYVARDATGATDTATVTVEVDEASGQSGVVARDDEAATVQDRAVEVQPLANDSGEDIRITDNGDATHGDVACDADSCLYTPDAGFNGADGFVYSIGRNVASRGGEGGNPGGPRESSAIVHILVAPAGTGYGIDVTGAAADGSGGAVPPGGQARWTLGAFGTPEGISGEELRALDPPAGEATLSGPHGLDGGSLQSAQGWSSEVSGGKLVYRAGEGALLGEAMSQAFPKPLPPISQGTGGDGHVPILVGSKVFAFYHHTDPTSATCVDRATGAVCPGYPKRLDFGDGNGFGTTDINGPAVVSGSKMWTHLENSHGYSGSASIGLFCWDAETDSTCGLTIVDRVAGNEDPWTSAPMLAAGKMWFGGDTGKLYCVDPASGAVCDPIDTGHAPATAQGYDAVVHGTRVFVARRDATVACVDVAARTRCPGWETPKAFGGRWDVVNWHDATGATIGVCVFRTSTGSCVRDDAPDTSTAVNNFVQREDYGPGYSWTQEAEIGTRTLVGSLSTDGFGCYDWTTMAPCTGGRYGTDGAPPGWVTRQDDGSSFPPFGAYGLAYDGSCAIALGDVGMVYTVDPAGGAPCVSLGTGTEKTTIDLRSQRCDGTVGAASWRNVRLSETDEEEMESVVVTIRDAVTQEVLRSGEMVGGEQTLDLSGIDPVAHPAITIDATAKSKEGDAAWEDGLAPRIRLTWNSDPQSSCVRTTGDAACGPAGSTLGLRGTLANGASDEATLALRREPCAAGGVLGTQEQSCLSRRRTTITLRIEKELRRLKASKRQVKSVRIVVAGRRVRAFKRGGRWRARIDLTGLRKGRYAIRITVTLKNGRKITGTRRYRTCRRPIPGGPPPL